MTMTIIIIMMAIFVERSIAIRLPWHNGVERNNSMVWDFIHCGVQQTARNAHAAKFYAQIMNCWMSQLHKTNHLAWEWECCKSIFGSHTHAHAHNVHVHNRHISVCFPQFVDFVCWKGANAQFMARPFLFLSKFDRLDLVYCVQLNYLAIQ